MSITFPCRKNIKVSWSFCWIQLFLSVPFSNVQGQTWPTYFIHKLPLLEWKDPMHFIFFYFTEITRTHLRKRDGEHETPRLHWIQKRGFHLHTPRFQRKSVALMESSLRTECNSYYGPLWEKEPNACTNRGGHVCLKAPHIFTASGLSYYFPCIKQISIS